MYIIQAKRFGKAAEWLNLYIVKNPCYVVDENKTKEMNAPEIRPPAPNAASINALDRSKTIFVLYYSIYTFTASKKVNLI